MSREFGDYGSTGFFHDKVWSALNDLKTEASEDFHKEFIPIFQELYEIAYAISSVEAGDSCIERSIVKSMESVPRMKEHLDKIEEILRPYRRIAEKAVRDMVDKS